MKSHRAESDPGRARGLPVFAREVGHLREAVGRGKRANRDLSPLDLRKGEWGLSPLDFQEE